MYTMLLSSLDGLCKYSFFRILIVKAVEELLLKKNEITLLLRTPVIVHVSRVLGWRVTVLKGLLHATDNRTKEVIMINE